MKKILSENENFVYYVDEEKGVCICKCPTALESFEKEVESLVGIDYNGASWFEKPNYLIKVSSEWFARFGSNMNRIFGKSKANLEAGEVFNEEKGCEIARARLIEKLAEYRQGYYQDIAWALDEMRKIANKRADGNYRIRDNALTKWFTLSGLGEEEI